MGNINAFPDEDSNCEDLEPRSNAVWEITLDTAASANFDDDNTVSDTNDDDTLALYNMPDLQAACPDCREIINYLCYGILPGHDAAARKVTFQAERYTMLDNILYYLDLPRQKKRLTSEPVTQQLVVPRNLRELLLRSEKNI